MTKRTERRKARMNRKERREGAALLLAMRHVYPGDSDNAMYRDARRLNPKLPPIRNDVKFVFL